MRRAITYLTIATLAIAGTAGVALATSVATITFAGQWATYDFPGANNFTTLERVNDHNVATGYYTDASGLDHGFTAQVALSSAS